MKQFLMEMHAHTSQTSPCGHIDAETLVKLYKESDYDGVVITDHYTPRFFENLPKKMSLKDKIDQWLIGYRAAKAAADDDLVILLGMELTVREYGNDYLIYGFDEDFLYNTEIEDILNLEIEQLFHFFDMRGFLIFQAHPFRNHMTVVPSNCLHGMEVYNGNARHKSNNEIASLWAENKGLMKVSGSDFHKLEDLARGGIYFPQEIQNTQQLVKALKEKYTLRVSI